MKQHRWAFLPFSLMLVWFLAITAGLFTCKKGESVERPWTVNIVILEDADMIIHKADGSFITAHHPAGTAYLGDWGSQLPTIIPQGADVLAKKSSDDGQTWEEFIWSFEGQTFHWVSIIRPLNPPPPPRPVPENNMR